MLRPAFFWLLFLYVADARIYVFNIDKKEHLATFANYYKLNYSIIQKINSLENIVPSKIIITQNGIDIGGYILTKSNKNLGIKIARSKGFQEVRLADISEKYTQRYIFKYNLAKDEQESLKELSRLFFKKSNIELQHIKIVEKKLKFGKIEIPTKQKAYLLKGTDGYLLAFSLEDGLYNKYGQRIVGKKTSIPLRFSRISDHYSRDRFHPILKYFKAHEGVDLVAKLDTPVYAAMDGFILKASYGPIIGNYVKIAHQNSLETVYGHLSKVRSDLRPGKKINRGELLGLVGQSGLATGPHLHFGAKKNGRYIDPIFLLETGEKKVQTVEFFDFVSKSSELLLKTIK